MPIGYFIGGGQLTNLSYDISDPQNPIVNFDGTYRDVDYPVKLLVDAIGGLYTETDQFKFDISRENSRGQLKFGFQYDDRVATGGGATLATISVSGGYPADVCNPKDYRLGDFATSRNNDVGAFYTDNPALNECLNTVRPPRSDFPDDEKINIEETLMAAYIMQTFDMEWGNIIAGLRIEDTEYQTVGFRLATVSGDIGYENIGGFKKLFDKSLNMIWAIFIFGLIHGLGLSTRLQQLPLGEEGIVLRILSFNLGIELGQIGALCLMTALLFKWRDTSSFQKLSTLSNRGIIYAGVYLFLMQMHGYSHAIAPDEFGFPEDNHFHAHEKMSSPSVSGSEYGIFPEDDSTELFPGSRR